MIGLFAFVHFMGFYCGLCNILGIKNSYCRKKKEEVLKRKWGWIGHTLRKEPSNVTRQALEWNPQGKRKVGRPKESWRRSVEKEAKEAGWTWSHLKKMAQNRTRWRSFVAALCPTWDEEE